MIAILGAAGAAIALMLALPRMLSGPTLHDRALGAYSIVLRAALVCAALAVASGQSQWLDTALTLVLCALALAATALKFFRARTFQAPLVRRGEDW